MVRLMKRCGWLVLLGVTGCASTPRMTAKCAFQAGHAGAYSWSSATAPDAACQFEIQADAGSAKDAQRFAEAWRAMFQASPIPPGVKVEQPEIKTEQPKN